MQLFAPARTVVLFGVALLATLSAALIIAEARDDSEYLCFQSKVEMGTQQCLSRLW